MSISDLVEQSLQNALKYMMQTTPIQKITIDKLSRQAGLARHTFYNHYQDIYELLGAVYQKEIISVVNNTVDLGDWKKALRQLLDYTYENRKICLNTYDSLGRDHLLRFLDEVFYHIIATYIAELPAAAHVSDDQREENITFFCSALSGVFTSWLRSRLRMSPEEMADMVIRNLDGVVEFVFMRLDQS